MILLDTNALVALVDQQDQLHERAVDDLDRFPGKALLISWPVLTEAVHFLPRRDQRLYLCELIQRCPLELPTETLLPSLDDILGWLAKHDSQQPDFADAFLVCMSTKNRNAKVWSYDSEFRNIWRRPDGSMVPMAVK